MPVSEQTPPRLTRESKYQYSDEDVDAAIKMLQDGKSPGDGPYESPGQARGAANSLLREIEPEVGDDFGSRVWEDDDGFHFALKAGRKVVQRKGSGGKK